MRWNPFETRGFGDFRGCRQAKHLYLLGLGCFTCGTTLAMIESTRNPTVAFSTLSRYRRQSASEEGRDQERCRDDSREEGRGGEEDHHGQEGDHHGEGDHRQEGGAGQEGDHREEGDRRQEGPGQDHGRGKEGAREEGTGEEGTGPEDDHRGKEGPGQEGAREESTGKDGRRCEEDRGQEVAGRQEGDRRQEGAGQQGPGEEGARPRLIFTPVRLFTPVRQSLRGATRRGNAPQCGSKPGQSSSFQLGSFSQASLRSSTFSSARAASSGDPYGPSRSAAAHPWYGSTAWCFMQKYHSLL